jgi:hypothetical protein
LRLSDDGVAVGQRQPSARQHDLAIDDHRIDVVAGRAVHQHAIAVDQRRQRRRAIVEHHDVGALADLEGAHLVAHADRLGTLARAPVEDGARIEHVALAVDALHGDRPAHRLDQVAREGVGAERDAGTGFLQLHDRRDAPALGIADRRMRYRHPGLAAKLDIGTVHVDAVRGDQLLVQEPELVHQLGRRETGPLLHRVDLGRQLREMGVDVAAVCVGELLDLAQQVVGASVGRVRRPIAADAAVIVAVPALDQLSILLEARLADGATVLVLAGRQRTGVGIVHAAGDHGAQAKLGRRAGTGRRIAIEIDHGRAAGAQQLVHTEARQRIGVVRRQPVALRDAGRVHRREADILDHAARDHERRVVVDVHQARHDDAAFAVDRFGGRPART